MQPIRFGTAGWRAILAEQYTFYNVRAVARATAHWFRKLPREDPVAVGHDTRFMGEKFARAVADGLAAVGVEPVRVSSQLPSARPIFTPSRRFTKTSG